jgi:hypothetical protein
VAHVFAEANVADDNKVFSAGFFEFTDDFLDNAIFSISACARLILIRGNTEKQNAFNAQSQGLFAFFSDHAYWQSTVAWHGINGDGFFDGFVNENWVNQVAWSKADLV